MYSAYTISRGYDADGDDDDDGHNDLCPFPPPRPIPEDPINSGKESDPSAHYPIQELQHSPQYFPPEEPLLPSNSLTLSVPMMG